MESLLWVQSLQLKKVVFESDCKTFVDTFVYLKQDTTEYGDIIGRWKDMLSHNTHFRVIFIKRHCNKVAHKLAKFSVLSPCSSVFNFAQQGIRSVLAMEII